MENPYLQDCHWVPQAAYVYGWDSTTLKVDRSNGRTCKNVLRSDHLAQDFNTLMERYGYPFRFNERRKSAFTSGKSCNSLKPEMLTPSNLNFLKRYYAEDYEVINSINEEYKAGKVPEATGPR